jgi:hypothetical protein
MHYCYGHYCHGPGLVGAKTGEQELGAVTLSLKSIFQRMPIFGMGDHPTHRTLPRNRTINRSA